LGGNVQVLNNGKRYEADKIPVKEIGMKKFQDEVFKMLKIVNKDFNKMFGYKLWQDEKLIDEATIFNGSSSYLLDPENLSKEEELMLLKPTAGDMDIVVPESCKEDLYTYLKSVEGKTLGHFIYIGSNKPEISSIGEQINCLMEYDYKFKGEDKKVFCQIDWEFTEFKDDDAGLSVPSEWAKFGHSSTLRDLEAGVKAVFHKYLLRSLGYGLSSKDTTKYLKVTPKSTCAKYKISTAKMKELHFLKFSVTKGLRIGYEPFKDCEGNDIVVDGKIVLREKPSATDIYETDINDIFKMFFNRDATKKELDDFWSFAGVIDLLENFDKKVIQAIYDRFIDLIWQCVPGHNIAQELERANPELDYTIKMGAMNYFIKKFSYLKEPTDTIEMYYSQYGKGKTLKECLEEIKYCN